MSTSVDNKVVSMKFDNAQFEAGVKTSMRSVEELNKIKFDGATKAFDGLDKITKGFNMQPMQSAIEQISGRFTTMGIAGMAAIDNLTNRVVNAGITMANGLTVAPVSSGLTEYETKMNSIQTILTNTKSKGTTLDQVNGSLSELNTYADQTIYNFAEMTRNIGTFTAAGVDLNTATTSIKGIANLAAGSGSNALQASTAMYQLSQAISTGKVALMDWNSVTNAGMGGELFQKALEKNAAAMGKGRDMAKSFRDSLSDDWLTTEVLTKTLQEFAADPSLIKAATEVKTFTQLFDTMKESVQSGWAVSWEQIIGNKEQATATLTAINDAFGRLMGPSTEARNKMLAFWNANGGRDAMIKGLANTFQFLGSVLKPISEAFREIFPPMTGEKLVEISLAFQKLTEKFKMTEATTALIKTSFKGLFSVFSILRTIVTAVFDALAPVTGAFDNMGGGILKGTGFLGELITKFDAFLKQSDALGKGADKIASGFTSAFATMKGGIEEVKAKVKELAGEAFDTASAKVTNGIARIRAAIESFKTIAINPGGGFATGVAESFKPMDLMSDKMEAFKASMSALAAKLSPVFKFISDTAEKAFGKIKAILDVIFSKETFDTGVDVAKTGALVMVGLAIKNFFDNLSKITKGAKTIVDSFKGVIDSVAEVLDGVRGCLEAWQTSLKAKSLMTIALAVAVLTGAIYVLTLIDPKKLATALAAMTTMFAELLGTLAILSKIDTNGLSGFSSVLLSFGISILLIAKAVAQMASLDGDAFGRGIVGITTVFGLLIASVRSMGKIQGPMMDGSKNMIAFAVALNILVLAVCNLGGIDPKNFFQGIAGLTTLISVVTVATNQLSKASGKMLQGVAGLIALAIAINILTLAVGLLGAMDKKTLIKGLGSVSILLAGIALFLKVSDLENASWKSLAGLLAVAGAIKLLAGVVTTLGSIDKKTLIKGLGGIGVLLASLGVFLRVAGNNDAALSSAISLGIVCLALVELSKTIKVLGEMPWMDMWQGITGMLATLTILALALKIIPKDSAKIGAGLIIVSIGLMMLAKTVAFLGGLSLGTIVTGLLALTAVLAIIGVAGLLLSPIVPVLMTLGTAIMLIGIGSLLAGTGLWAFAAALAVLSTVGVAAILGLGAAIISLIPMLAENLAVGITTFLTTLAAESAKIVTAICDLIIAIVAGVAQTAPILFAEVTNMIIQLLTILAQNVPTFVQKAFDILMGFLTGIKNNIFRVVQTGIEIVLNFIAGINSKLPDIINAAFTTIITFINGLADAIDSHGQELIDAVIKLFLAVIKFAIKALVSGLSKIFEVGAKILKWFIDGVKSIFGSLGKIAGDIIDAIVDGIKEGAKAVKKIGKWIVEGIIDGIKDMAGGVVDAAKDIAGGAIDGVKGFLGINSPSKEMMYLGQWAGIGLANGITNTGKAVTKASAGVGKLALDSMNTAVSKIANLLDSDIDYSPTITPVLDLDSLKREAKSIGGLFGTTTVGLANTTSQTIKSNQNGSAGTVDNSSTSNSSVSFVQNNYSPEALSHLEIYRQTQNQISAMKGALSGV